ncbi:MAG: pseudouridine synthase [Bacteroidota bacterium]
MAKDQTEPNEPLSEELEPKKRRRRKRIVRQKPTDGDFRRETESPKELSDEPTRLNRFIARAGVCSRRKADDLIAAGKITVNGEVVTEMGVKVIPSKDEVLYDGKKLIPQNFVYVLFNKPRNMLASPNDPMGKRVVLDSIYRVTNEEVFPVGKMDRNTTGLLLLTNDGELTSKMTHPAHKVTKIYHIRLNKAMRESDMDKLLEGIELEDGPAKVDKIDYVIDRGPNHVGIDIHIGRNRIVRRMFEHLGYEIIALDRVTIGPLNKRNLPRGKWRKLTDQEIGWLKML